MGTVITGAPTVVAVGPGIIPAVNMPCLVDIFDDGIILIPHDIVLADIHRALLSYGSPFFDHNEF